MSTSQQIQQQVYDWACAHEFTAPYGVLTGQSTSRRGTPFYTVTFGYARTLDATVEIYNPKFMRLISSRQSHSPQVFNSAADLMAALSQL